jgi:hypothetical protein
MSIQFKDIDLLPQWNNEKLRKDLRLFVLAANAYAEHVFGRSLMVTSIFRDYKKEKELGRSGVHGCWRGVDLSARGWAAPDIVKICDFVNEVVDYGQGKDVCFAHNAGSGIHFHVQVPAGAPKIKHV